jgi:OOP family OmpA-OmpF porin
LLNFRKLLLLKYLNLPFHLTFMDCFMTSNFMRNGFFVLVTVAVLSGCGKDGAPKSVNSSGKTAAPVDVVASGSATTTLPRAAEEKFSLDQVPVTSAVLPPFPYLTFPSALPDEFRKNDQELAFDEAVVVAGSKLHKVEGRILTRFFSNAQAGLSSSAARRNYQQALEAMGAVKVNNVKPTDKKLVGKDGDIEQILAKMRLPDAGPRFKDRGLTDYDCYVVRTASGNVWFTVTSDADGMNTFLMVVQEKPLQQSITALTAESLGKALATDGHLALYLSFDTDRATLRPDSAPVIAEVVKLMQVDSGLRLRIEGHTDDVGSGAHNETLSAMRADSVKAALVANKISASRLEAKGFGATKPIADNTDEPGRLKNRRVEMVKL